MTLSAEYIETIEQYLLSWELKYREFYDEILDHYCTDIERQMNDGLNFDDAFGQTNQKFSKYYYGQKNGPEWVNEVQYHYGPKAFEAEYVDGFRKTFSQKFKAYFLDAFRTYRIGFLGVLSMSFYFCFINNIFPTKDSYWMIIYLPIIIIYFILISEWIKNGHKLNIKSLFWVKEEEMLKMKKNKLLPNVKYGVLTQFFILPLILLPYYVQIIFRSNIFVSLEVSAVIKTFILSLYFTYSWVIIRLLMENTSSWNLMKFKK